MRTLNDFELVAVSGGFFDDPFADESFSGGGSSYGGYTPSLAANTTGGSVTYVTLSPVTIVGQRMGPSAADVVMIAGLGRAAGVAGAAFGEGIAIGFGAGSWLGPAGGVIGAMIGAGVAYYAFQ